MTKLEYVYRVEARDCWEYYTISLHRTRKGAYKVGNKFLNDNHDRGFSSRECIGKDLNDFMSRYTSFKIIKEQILE